MVNIVHFVAYFFHNKKVFKSFLSVFYREKAKLEFLSFVAQVKIRRVARK